MTVTVTIAGTGSGSIPFESLRIEEALAMPGPSPSTAEFEIVDKTNAVTIGDLADVVIADGAESLFRGQVMSVETYPVGHYRRHRVTCADYNRITSGAYVYPGGAEGAGYEDPTAYLQKIAAIGGQGITEVEIARSQEAYADLVAWLGRWQGQPTDYVFRRLVDEWWIDPPDRTGITGAAATRNVATLASDVTFPPYVEGRVTVTNAADIALTEPYHAWLDGHRVEVNNGMGTTDLVVGATGRDWETGFTVTAGTKLYGPMTDYVTHVTGGQVLRDAYTWLDLPLDTVLADLCTLTSAGHMYWLDADLVWHFGQWPPTQAGTWTLSADERLARRLPYLPVMTEYAATVGFSDVPDGVATFPTYDLVLTRSMDTIARGAYVRGETIGGSGYVANDDAPALAPLIVLGVPSANSGQAHSYATGELAMRKSGLVNLAFSTLGGSGWHRGMTVAVTNAVLGLSATEYVIRSVRLTLASADAVRRYELELGDTRSFAMSRGFSGTRTADRAPRSTVPKPDSVETKKLKPPAAKWTIAPLWDHAPKPGWAETLICQLTTTAGDPMMTPGITVTWTLWKNGEAIGIGDATKGSYLRDLTSVTDFAGRARNFWYLTAAATEIDEFLVTVVSEA